MLWSEHDDARCGPCGSTLWYGLKEEPTGWKVFYACLARDGCGSEWFLGRIDRRGIKSIDDAYRRAESMWDEVGSGR